VAARSIGFPTAQQEGAMEDLGVLPGRRRRWMWVGLVLMALAGCASYQPRPLDQVPFMERGKVCG
jgi:hypothetical protein